MYTEVISIITSSNAFLIEALFYTVWVEFAAKPITRFCRICSSFVAYLWDLRWWPQCLQYAFSHSSPLVLGEKPGQSQPTVPLQCLPWHDTSVHTSLFTSVLEVKEQTPITTTADTINVETAQIIFFIIKYPDSCRAQPLIVIFNWTFYSLWTQ